MNPEPVPEMQAPESTERKGPHTKRYRRNLARKRFKENAKLLEEGVEAEESKVTAGADKLLKDDQERSHAERGLLFDTAVRMRQFPSALLEELKQLFGKKKVLSNSPQERIEDDQSRRMAVLKLMTMREENGIERPNEASLWSDMTINITNELNTKFGSGYFGMTISLLELMYWPISLLKLL